MKLHKLALRNFQGIKSLDLEPGGEDMAIAGANGSGKTTVANSVFWLLFGKSASGATSFGIKTHDASGDVIHNLDHGVTATFDMDGAALELGRTYKEKWEKQRGSASATFTGHTTDFTINTVPVSEAEYTKRIASICDEKVFRLLTDPHHFLGRLPWAERRKMLMDLCGDVPDLEVIEANPALSRLPVILGAHTLEQYRAILKQRCKLINEELTLIPARIDEAARAISEAPKGDYEAQGRKLRAELQALQEKRAGASSGGMIAELTTQLRTVEGEGLAAVNRLRQAGNPARDAALQRQTALRLELGNAEMTAKDIEARIVAGDASIRRMDDSLAELRARVASTKEAGQAVAGACAACGQALPPERVAEALAQANEIKARAVAAIVEEGKALRARRDEAAVKMDGWRFDGDAAAATVARLKAEIEAHEIPEALAAGDPTTDPECVRCRAEIARLEGEIAGLRSGAEDALALIDVAIVACQVEITEAAEALAAVGRNADASARVKTLGAREKELAGQYEAAQEETFLCEEFIRAKCSLSTERVNGLFETITWRLFRTLVNGAVEECCEAIVAPSGSTYGTDLNGAGEINAGMECCEVLGTARGFWPPIIIDGAESVTDIRPTRAQQITLRVSADDKVLRVETREKEATR